MTTISLDGEWWLRGCLGATWEWYVGPTASAEGWIPARVPGSVLDDLFHAGMVPDPYVGLNSLACEWVPERSWVYRRWLPDEVAGSGRNVVLRFDGVDHAASVWIDGVEVGRHEGMFDAFELDVTEHLRPATRHLLAVVVEPAPRLEPQVGRTSRVRLHKTRMVYGWDFCPRLPHQGIWRSARLELWSGARLRELSAATTLSADHRDGRLEATVDVQTDGHADAELELRLLDGRGVVERVRQPIDALSGGAAHLELGVVSPRLWWPNGMGRPHQYRAEARILGLDGGQPVTDARVGFRLIELAPNAGAPSSARPYTFVVNGRRQYARGWNWVPIDALYGVPRPAKLAHLLDLAASANVNLLRVWGGGLIESEAFYRRCDDLGLLVWQEFALSSSGMDSRPADDPSFVAHMADQAARIVPRLRHHASLALWCGGNELAGEGDVPLDESSPVIGALRDEVRRRDPGRGWLPTSPSGPAPHHRPEAIAADPDGQHDVHGLWEHQGLARHCGFYDAGTSLLHSEFGVEGMTNRRALEALVPVDRRWPPDRGNPVYEHLGAWWNNLPLVQEAFAGRLTDIDGVRRASQYLQADGLRYAVEANRRRAPRNSGTIPWQFNESYPNAWCTAAVDHRGDAKPAYHAVRRAYQSPYVSASFDRQAWDGAATVGAVIWAGADWPVTLTGTVTARIVNLDGTVSAERSWRLADEDGSPRALGELSTDSAKLPADLFLLDVRLTDPDGRVTVSNRYLMTRGKDLGPVLDVAPAGVSVVSREHGDTWWVELVHESGPAALGIVLEDDRPHEAAGWAVFDENLIDLLPGERRQVEVAWREASVAGRRLRIQGWNTDTLVVP